MEFYISNSDISNMFFPINRLFHFIHEFLILGKITLIFISFPTTTKYLSLKWVILYICKNLFGHVVPPSDLMVSETWVSFIKNLGIHSLITWSMVIIFNTFKCIVAPDVSIYKATLLNNKSNWSSPCFLDGFSRK